MLSGGAQAFMESGEVLSAWGHRGLQEPANYLTHMQLVAGAQVRCHVTKTSRQTNNLYVQGEKIQITK